MIGPKGALAAIGQLSDAEIDLAHAARQLPRARAPAAGWERAAAHLPDLAREASARGQFLGDRSPEIKLGGLAGLIGARYGYLGDNETYDDLANADLVRVTERRRGLPVALGIVWLHCIRAAGWEGRGIDFPRHFLIRLDGPRVSEPRPQILVDVFAGGQATTAADLLAMARRRASDEAKIGPELVRPMTNRQILLRLQRNIVERQRASGAWEDAIVTLQGMVAIAPGEAGLWRDQAALHQRLGHLRAAIDCLQRFVALAPTGIAADQARDGIDAIRRRLA